MARNTAALPARMAPTPHTRGHISARAVGTYVPKLTHKAFEKYGFAAAALLTDWAIIVGTDVAQYTAPERLKWPRGVDIGGDVENGAQGRPGATLIVRVDPARALDAQYKAQQIIERINGHFGYRAVGELRLLQAPLPERARAPAEAPRAPVTPDTAPELAGIADERLRAALANLKSGLTHRAQSR
jgi:hypothetical protein